MDARDLACTLVTGFDEPGALQAEWDEAVLRLRGPIYMTYDWLRTWWEFYGEGRLLRLFLFRHQDKLVALVPLYVERFGLGPLKTTVARLVGANIPPKTFDPPVSAEWTAQVFPSILNQLFAHDHCDLLSFGPVSSAWDSTHSLAQACGPASGLSGGVVHVPRGTYTLFRLPRAFDEYLNALPRGERKERLRRLRRLVEEHHAVSDVIAEPGAAEHEFDGFLEQHAMQWRVVGKGGHFQAWPSGEAFNRALVKRQASLGRVRFFRLVADGNVVARRYAYVLGDTLFAELPARAVGDPWDKLGIGVSSWLRVIEDAIRLGIAQVNSGLGTYEHKTRLGGEEIAVGIWRIAGRRWASRFRARAFLALGAALRLVFHKLWYRRIVPSLPGRVGRSQSLFWLRYEV